ncbi:hypothetical protein [Edaphobacter modestus]|uniref:hypothetical protein n=1 Tax=Edaphobacter modestus TaxID=388466 RepID=UPI00102ADA62|nr:hypothetical protein [Edaphobacter modestus]
MARRAGVAVGTSRLQAESFSHIQLLRRSPEQGRASRTALLECASSFSPRIELIQMQHVPEPSGLMMLDIHGTEALVGPPEVLINKLRQRASAHGFSPISPRRRTSMSLSVRHEVSRGADRRAGKELEMLAPLPLHVLDLLSDMAETYHLWGIRNCRMLAVLPERDLVARVGFKGQRLRALARGEHSHFFVPIEPSFASQLVESMELEHPVELLEPLLFLFSRLLDQLSAARADPLSGYRLD